MKTLLWIVSGEDMKKILLLVFKSLKDITDIIFENYMTLSSA